MNIHPLGLLVMLALIAPIGLLRASISYAPALGLQSEDAFAPLIFTATLPLLLLSGVLLPMSLAPAFRNLGIPSVPGHAYKRGRQQQP